MRTSQRLQRHRSQYRKGQPRRWILGAPKYSTNQVLNARCLMQQVAESAAAINVDYYVFKD